MLVFDTSRRLRRVKFAVKTMLHIVNQQLLLLLMDSIAPKIGKLWRKNIIWIGLGLIFIFEEAKEEEGRKLRKLH